MGAEGDQVQVTDDWTLSLGELSTWEPPAMGRPEDRLNLNVRGYGTPGEVDVYIDQAVLGGIWRDVENTDGLENGGVLLGEVGQNEGRVFVDIKAYCLAQEAARGPAHITFTLECWTRFLDLLRDQYKDLRIVGWFHTHPGYGVFVSGTDQDTQDAFFPYAWAVALVLDPISREFGFFVKESEGQLSRTGWSLYRYSRTTSSADGGDGHAEADPEGTP